jgi:protein-arginine kinase activator protein McsA
MLCEKCKQREGTMSYTTPDKVAQEPMLQLCESCLADISPKVLDFIKKAQAGEKSPDGWTYYIPSSK